MKVVLIEDDLNKGRQITDFLAKCFPAIELTERRSYTSGLKEIRDSNPDLILLDMSIPNYDGDSVSDGGKFRSYGGRDILHQLLRRGLEIPVIVVTQYAAFSDESKSLGLAELSGELRAEFPNYIDTIFYSASEDAWRDRLKGHVERIGS
jgi:DNA-binding response OmpR family regulator